MKCEVALLKSCELEELDRLQVGTLIDHRERLPGEPVRCAVIRCLFGNPFRPVAFAPAWNTSAVLALAHTIYDARAFDRLPILADALEDAGCTDSEIIGHCRSGGEHVRGCWVVDLLTGRE